jgi:hypothetical protein
MDLIGKIQNILEQEEEKDIDLFGDVEDEEERLFVRMAEFIVGLEPDDLSDDDLETALNIIEDLEDFFGEELEEARPMAGKASAQKKSYARKWYRMSKNKIKRRKEKFNRSAEGRKRLSNKEKNKNRTPTGKRKERYHVSHKTEKERGGRKEWMD